MSNNVNKIQQLPSRVRLKVSSIPFRNVSLFLRFHLNSISDRDRDREYDLINSNNAIIFYFELTYKTQRITHIIHLHESTLNFRFWLLNVMESLKYTNFCAIISFIPIFFSSLLIKDCLEQWIQINGRYCCGGELS